MAAISYDGQLRALAGLAVIESECQASVVGVDGKQVELQAAADAVTVAKALELVASKV